MLKTRLARTVPEPLRIKMKAGGEGLSARGAPRPWWGERTNIFASSALAGRRRRSAPSPGERGRRVTGSPGVFSAPAGREGPLRSAPRRAEPRPPAGCPAWASGRAALLRGLRGLLGLLGLLAVGTLRSPAADRESLAGVCTLPLWCTELSLVFRIHHRSRFSAFSNYA